MVSIVLKEAHKASTKWHSALMPVSTHSAHWLADHRFANAVEQFLEREGSGVDNYLAHLDERNPFKRTT
jgi:uncharacterized protein